MREAPGEGSALNGDHLSSDPAVALLDASDIGTVAHTRDGQPAATDAPAVIEGEVQ